MTNRQRPSKSKRTQARSSGTLSSGRARTGRTASRIWIGADPGGRGRFGLAILDQTSVARAWCVDHADEAIAMLDEEFGPKLNNAAVGVDAPLWWSGGAGGRRKADEVLRDEYGVPHATVQSANSLRGAALVQAVMFVVGLWRIAPKIVVTESHPKALLRYLHHNANASTGRKFCKAFGVSLANPRDAENEDKRDAIIGAVAARAGDQRHWTRDLATERHGSELDPTADKYWLGRLHYWWPDPPSGGRRGHGRAARQR